MPLALIALETAEEDGEGVRLQA